MDVEPKYSIFTAWLSHLRLGARQLKGGRVASSGLSLYK